MCVCVCMCVNTQKASHCRPDGGYWWHAGWVIDGKIPTSGQQQQAV